MNTRKKNIKKIGINTVLAVFILVISFLVFPPADTCQANSAEPPSIIIIVPYAPDDLEITIVGEDPDIEITNRAYETYYAFYMHKIKSQAYTIRVTSSENTFEKHFSIFPQEYRNTYVLDLDKGEFTAGIPASRSMMLISLRVILTMLIEAGVFWGFGFREKRSWIAFILINLTTQGLLNVFLDSSIPLLGSYIVFSLLFGELFVFIGEMILFSFCVNEHNLLIRNVYVISANVLSLALGGFLIAVLPV